MAASKETITTKVLVKPEWDKPALKKMEREFGKTQKKLASMKMDWGQISKSSGSAVREIAKISSAAKAMSGELSAATKETVKNMAALAKQLQEAKKRAEELKRKAASASSPDERAQHEVGASAAEKEMMDLTRQLRENRKFERQNLNEIKQVIKARKAERDQLRKAASYSGKDLQKAVGNSIGQAFGGMKGGGLRGVMQTAGAARHAVRAGGQYSKAASARAALGEGSGVVAGLSKLVPVLAGATVGFAAFVGFVAKASSAITSMNKTLIEGAGTANDFTTKAGAYTEAIDDLRKASKDATGHLLTMGGSVEKTAGIINSYMKEASGSVVKTRDAMLTLGKGDTAKGVETFAKNAMMYGKALGMEANEVASMMGKLENEVGLGADQVQKSMEDIVKAAATSGMPVSKFMGIFHDTIPSLELYTNRMEELSGVIKMLSKNMSAADVKRYMDAFGKGFKGMSFEERVKHTLVAGIGTTNKILEQGFLKKADVIGQALGPELGDKFVDAFKKGDKAAMNDILVQAKASGAQASTIGEAQKLMGAESDRRQGGALGTASATKGASMRETMKLFEAELTRITGHVAGTRVSGINEHVAESRGMSSEMVEALNQYNSSMDLYMKSLQEYGTTVSKSMDSALRGILQKRMGKKDITAEDMAKASRDEIEQAAELSNKDEKVAQTAMDLQRENTDATMSLGEKLDNVISYILEQIYEKVSGILKVVSDIFNGMLDWWSGDSKKSSAKASIDKWNVKGYGAGSEESFKNYKESLKGGVEQGKSGVALANTAGDYYKSQYDKMIEEGKGSWAKANAATDPAERKKYAEEGKRSDDAAVALKEAMKQSIAKMLSGRGMHQAQQENLMRGVTEALDQGKFGKAMETVAAYSGKGDADALLEFGQNVLPKAITEADRRAGDKGAPGQMRRSGTSQAEVHRYQKDKEVADEVSDTVSNLQRVNAKTGAAADAVAAAVKEKPASSEQQSPGQPSSRASSPAAQTKAAESAHQELISSQEDNVDNTVKAVDDVYDGVHDVASILKRGIRYEPGFLSGQYSKTIRDSTLSSFKDALLEFGILQAKMQESPAIRRMMADYAYGVGVQGGAAMGAITTLNTNVSGPNEAWKDFDEKTKGSKQVGGPIPDTGNYRLHRGEYVVPALPATSSGRERGGDVHATVHINGANLSQKQLEAAVFNAIDRIARRP